MGGRPPTRDEQAENARTRIDDLKRSYGTARARWLPWVMALLVLATLLAVYLARS